MAKILPQKTTTKMFPISNSMPIKFNLLFGNLLLRTHQLPQINITAMSNTDERLIPEAIERFDHIEIKGQALKGFLPQNEKLSLEIKVPENSDVTIKCGAGVFEVYGKYNKFHAKLKAGEFKFYPSSVKEGSVNMWFGDNQIFLRPEDKIEYLKDSFRTKEAIINETLKVKCSVFLGNTRIGIPLKENHYPKY